MSDCSLRLSREVRRIFFILLFIQYIILHTYTMRPMRSSAEVTLQASLPPLLYMSATIRTRFPHIFHNFIRWRRAPRSPAPRHRIYLYRQPMRKMRPMRYFVGPFTRWRSRSTVAWATRRLSERCWGDITFGQLFGVRKDCYVSKTHRRYLD